MSMCIWSPKFLLPCSFMFRGMVNHKTCFFRGYVNMLNFVALHQMVYVYMGFQKYLGVLVGLEHWGPLVTCPLCYVDLVVMLYSRFLTSFLCVSIPLCPQLAIWVQHSHHLLGSSIKDIRMEGRGGVWPNADKGGDLVSADVLNV